MVSRIVIVRGPLWDGEADRAVDQWLDETRKKVADEGVLMLKAWPMDKTGRARGNFEERVHRVTRGQIEAIPGPTEQGITWAPWLEGTTRRNETTHFRGYGLFRKTRLRLARNWRKTAQDELYRYIRRMGGRVE